MSNIADILETIAAKTRTKKLKWEQLGARSFSAALGSLTVLISEERKNRLNYSSDKIAPNELDIDPDEYMDRIRFSILSDDGQALKRLIILNSDPYYPVFKELLGVIQSNIFAVDSVLIDVEKALARL